MKNLKVQDRVVLANGKKATITQVHTSWGSITGYTVKADGGTFAARLVDASGKGQDSDFDIVEVATGNLEGKLEAAKKAVAELQALLDKPVDDGFQEKMMDFGDGRGLVKARRHLNPEGDFGGYVAVGAGVSSSARIGRGSTVNAGSNVGAGAKVINNSKVVDSTIYSGQTIDGLMVNKGRLTSL